MAVFAVVATTFAEHMVLQPRSLEGATGGSWRRSGVRRLRLRALQARGPSGSGIRPGAQRLHAIRSLPGEGHAQRKCWKRAVKRERDPAGRPTPCGAPKGAAFPSPRARGTRTSAGTPRQACLVPGATRRSAPSACRGRKNPPARRETRRPAAGPSYAADDFAWLYDIVNETRAHGEARYINACPGRGAARSSYGAVHR